MKKLYIFSNFSFLVPTLLTELSYSDNKKGIESKEEMLQKSVNDVYPHIT